MKKFYRVSSPITEQGLWYNFKGEFTGLIHGEFDFCQNSKLEMPFDEKLVGWLSAVTDLADLWQWFSHEDVLELQTRGFYIHEYEAVEWQWYDKFQHWVINQETSKVIRRIEI